MEAFFEGTEERIRKWCPRFMSFYQKKRKALLEFVEARWQSNVMETNWINFGDYEEKKRGELEF